MFIQLPFLTILEMDYLGKNLFAQLAYLNFNPVGYVLKFLEYLAGKIAMCYLLKTNLKYCVRIRFPDHLRNLFSIFALI